MKRSYVPDEFIRAAGHLFIIGGGHRPGYLMKEFIRLSGGSDSRITILPLASCTPESTGERIKNELLHLGCTDVNYISPVNNKMDDKLNLEKLQSTKGIFFSGGDQNILAKYLHGTKTLDKIIEIYHNGGVIGGTSAGAAIMSKVMIAGSDPDEDYDLVGLSPQTNIKRNAVLSEGFGFLKNIIIDQHFNTRNRIDRLKDAIRKNPEMLGVGIDESTAIIVHTDNTFRVIGENKVSLFSLYDFGLIQKIDKEIEMLNSGRIHTIEPGERYLFDSYGKN